MQHRKLRKGGSVKRWHVTNNVLGQTVAAHSWGVACLVLDLWPDASLDLVRAALLHDVPEQDVGDVPAPAKWANPQLAAAIQRSEDDFWHTSGITFPSLGRQDALRLKVADMMELLWYCVEEERVGNRNFKEIFVRGVNYLQNMVLDDRALAMLNELIATEAEL